VRWARFCARVVVRRGIMTVLSPRRSAPTKSTAGSSRSLMGQGVSAAPEEPAAFELRDRIAHRADNTAQSAEKTNTTTTNVRRLCQHVQTVPVSQETFSCEQCNANLERRTAPR